MSLWIKTTVKMTEAIIFDLGGVLVNLDVERCKKAFIEDVGYRNIGDLLDASHQKGFYSDLEQGLISDEEFRRRILSGADPKAGVTDADCSKENAVDHAMWALLTGVDAYKIDLLRELRKKYDLYLLSNNNGISMVRCRQLFDEAGLPMDSIFRKEFLSYRMKMLKPSVGIYRKVVSEIGIAPDKMLFIDDSRANTDVASSVGINVLFYPQGSDLKTALYARLEELEKC